jgi:hypothetical protein
MSATHTPAPWTPHQQGDANFYVILHENKWLASIQFNGEQMEAKQMANLNVMAAAPELLEALTSIVEFWDANVPADYLSEQHKAARAAIAKATGAAS